MRRQQVLENMEGFDQKKNKLDQLSKQLFRHVGTFLIHTLPPF